MTDSKNLPVIFLAFANDRDDNVGYLRNLPDEARRLREVLKPAEQAGLCEVVVRSNSTADDIFKVFQDPEFRDRIAILHYGGHANGYQLLLESASGQAAAADAGGLAAFLAQQKGLQLIFLNGCSTQQQTQGLLEANIPAVISTSRAIDDEVATNFSHQFYQGLAGGASVRSAYNEAAAAVQTAKGGNTRSLYIGGKDAATGQPEADRWPWNLYLREGSEGADHWNLPEAVGDPLFGLPPLPQQDLPESPYRHLNWFTRKDAEVFFGRGHQIRELYDRLTAPRTAPIMLFYGQSGVGKSSVLAAGLIPRLEQDYDVCYLRRTDHGLLSTLQTAFESDSANVSLDAAWRAKEQQTGKPLIVFLDQVEEVYTHPSGDSSHELQDLLQALQATFSDANRRPKGKLVLGFRKEWLAELEVHLVNYELPRTKVFLEPLDRNGIIEAVRGPTRTERLRARYGLTVEDGLAEIIADDLLEDRDAAVAPTLQILMTKLWSKATEENEERPQITQTLYQQLKRDGILLRDFLNQQVAAFRNRYPEAVDSGLLLDIIALHTTALGTAGQRSIEELEQEYAHLDATLADLVQQCQDLHLLTVATSGQKRSTRTTRLAHDTLAPLIREQFEKSDKPGQRARRILDNRSVDWAEEKVGTPLDEADLAVVEEGAKGTRSLSATEQRLLEASQSLRKKLQRNRKIQKFTSIAFVAVIALAGAYGWVQKAKADKWAQEAEAQTQVAFIQILNILSRPEFFKIDEIVSGGSAPGRIEATDSDAWIPLVNIGGYDFVMARPYGDGTPGRILAAGHDSILIAGKTPGDALFADMALTWLRGKRGTVAVISEGHAETTKIYNLNPKLEARLRAWHYELRSIPDLSNYEQMRDVGVLILGNAWQDFSPSEFAGIERFVREGGGLLALGLGWSWADYGPDGQPNRPPIDINDYPMNKLMEQFGIRWTTDYISMKQTQ